MTVEWALRIFTYVVVVFTWWLCYRMAKRATRASLEADLYLEELLHTTVMAMAARAKLYEVDPNAQVDIPLETWEWIQRKHAEYVQAREGHPEGWSPWKPPEG